MKDSKTQDSPAALVSLFTVYSESGTQTYNS